jgi:cellulose synthase/poly-beta-1,6-N-acetylglucosamine synthase-like glycosyltransferase
LQKITIHYFETDSFGRIRKFPSKKIYFRRNISKGMHFPSMSLVIPCYNEANRVKLLFQGVEDFKNQWQGEFEVIIVDDGSSDDTARYIQEHTCFVELCRQGKSN